MIGYDASTLPCHAMIRTGARRDIDAIVALWSEMANEHRTMDPRYTFAPEAPTAVARHIRRSMACNDSRVFVADLHGRPIGYILAEVHRRSPIYPIGVYGCISDLCVTISERRRGIGSALVRHTFRWFEMRGVTASELHAAELNQTAQAFWRAMGYEPYIRLMRRSMYAGEEIEQ